MTKKQEEIDLELIVASKMKSVFSNGDGRDVLKYLMSETGYIGTNYIEGSTSPDDLLFREGRRSLIAEIIQATNLDIKQLADQSLTEQGEWNAHRT